ncbi:carbohydrate ABC transporter permease [Corynebacterium kroppenstedtii]|uniref:Glycerol-3-phosphate ABC transporter permease n=1 Tax=Corynebacterium kroppenstedtii TaxID=161879 RepID=A0A2W5STV3_9CORY|nr:sugar ABC transporter permease [Corynebacterium kroppenstedtii]MDU7286376.1 sugar ABC transporter permease [Corynebacterium kroppenstedtii]PZR06212.1 MAG: glycerol-3-phosphate ABC transporter permease [Corynebacterium kroppenstedtii]
MLDSQSTHAPDTKRAQRKETLLAAVLLFPNLLLLTVFTYRPLIDNIRLSFFRWNISSPSATFVGLNNYKEWLTRDDTRTIVLNTLVFTGFAVIGSMALGLMLALILDQKLFGRNAVRSIAFAPFALSGAAIGVAFQFIFDPHFGLIQDILSRFHIPVPNFYSEPAWALFMVTFTFIWKNLGYTFVIYLAALQGVNKELDEAAAIDGAGPWPRLWKVILPQLRPSTFFLSITVMLNSVQVFDIISVMTRGGPQTTGTTTLVYQVYQETFTNFRAGYGATVATILFLILLCLTLVQVRYMDRQMDNGR